MTPPYFVETSQGKDEKWLLEEKYSGIETPEYEADKKRLASGEPLAYVIGWQPFLGLKIHLDSKPLIPPYSAKATQGTRPLIPRSETEWWTEQLLANVGPRRSYMRSSKLKFLDLCAGSGAIGCAALKTLPYMEVFFGEINPAHEATILKNIRENNLDESHAPLETPAAGGPGAKGALSLTGRANIRIGDLFEPFESMKFDVIASNPPYVPHDRVLPPSVADYEPALAFYAGKEGLDFIRRIAATVRCHLTDDGEAWIECDRAHAAEACALFHAQGLSAEIRNDQYGKPRVILVHPVRDKASLMPGLL